MKSLFTLKKDAQQHLGKLGLGGSDLASVTIQAGVKSREKGATCGLPGLSGPFLPSGERATKDFGNLTLAGER